MRQTSGKSGVDYFFSTCYHLPLKFEVSKMGLDSLVSQPVSVLRAKLWKVVIHEKI